MNCDRDPLLLAEESDASPEERLELLRHLGRCGVCRRRLAEHDPSLLFRLLLLDDPPDEILDRLSERLDRALPAQPGPLPRHTPIRAWIAVAASLLLAGVFSTYLWTPERNPPPVAPATVSAALPSGQPLPSFPEAFEVLYSPGEAQVLDMTVGEVQLVMIFDEDLNL